MSRATRARWYRQMQQAQGCTPGLNGDTNMTLNGYSTHLAPTMPFATHNAMATPDQAHADEQRRTLAFRQFIEKHLEMAKLSRDPIFVWTDMGNVEARVLLGFSAGNRAEPAPTVEMYSRDIDNEWWMQTHQGFAIAKSGWLGDGHHRCKALAASDKTIRVCIAFGVDDAAFAVVDTGRGRSIPDQVSVRRGVRCSNRVVSAVRMCMALSEGKQYIAKWSVPELDAGIEAHRAAVDALGKRASSRYPAAFWGAMLYAHPVNSNAIEDFADKILSGENLTGPALTLREFLIHGAKKADPFTIAQRTLYAVRAQIEQRHFTKFSVRDDGAIFDWFAARLATRGR